MVNPLAALGLFYSGFVHTFWGNDPYLGWAIMIIAAFILAEPLLAVMGRLGVTGRRRRWAVIGTFLLVSWVSLGVGELPEKTKMMLDNLANAEDNRRLVDGFTKSGITKVTVFEQRDNRIAFGFALNPNDLHAVKKLTRSRFHGNLRFQALFHQLINNRISPLSFVIGVHEHKPVISNRQLLEANGAFCCRRHSCRGGDGLCF